MWYWVLITVLLCAAAILPLVLWTESLSLLRQARQILMLLSISSALLCIVFHFWPSSVPSLLTDALAPITTQLVQDRPWLALLGPRPWLIVGAALLLTSLSLAARSFRQPPWLAGEPPTKSSSRPVIRVGLIASCLREESELIDQICLGLDRHRRQLDFQLAVTERLRRDLLRNRGNHDGRDPANVEVLWQVVACPPRDARDSDWQNFAEELQLTTAFVRTALDQAEESSQRILAVILTRVDACYDTEELARLHMPRLLARLSGYLRPLLAHPRLARAAIFPVSVRGFGAPEGERERRPRKRVRPYNLVFPVLWSIRAAIGCWPTTTRTTESTDLLHLSRRLREDMQTAAGWIWPLENT